MNAVGAVDIGIAGRTEHHGVARGASAEAMRRGFGVVIGLDLDDDAADAIEQQRRADQSGATAWTLRAKKLEWSGTDIAAKF